MEPDFRRIQCTKKGSLVGRSRNLDGSADGSRGGHVANPPRHQPWSRLRSEIRDYSRNVQTLVPIISLSRRRRRVGVPRRVDQEVSVVHLEDGGIDRPDVSAGHDDPVCRTNIQVISQTIDIDGHQEDLLSVPTFVLVGIQRILTSFEDMRKLIVKCTVSSGGIVARRRDHDE